MANVEISGLTKTYGTFRAVSDIELSVHDGEFLIFLGPSGCGKTTTLRMLAGFIEPDGGRVHLGGRDITHEPPHRRNIGLVFQNYALFPHLSIFENVAFGLRRRKLPDAEIRKRVTDALELVELGHLADRLPKQLSGGQQQRVAIARAIAIRPDILLLDEPLSNLDARLRLQVRDELRNLQKTLGITTIMVTHDQEEAMSVGDRLVLMRSGVIEQVGTAQQLYYQPANRFVADFIGRTNFLNGGGDGSIFCTAGGVVLHSTHRLPAEGEVMVRPEAIRLSAGHATGAASGPASGVISGLGAGQIVGQISDPVAGALAGPHGVNSLNARISDFIFLGGIVEIGLRLEGGERLMAVTSPGAIRDAGIELRPDTAVTLNISAVDIIGM